MNDRPRICFIHLPKTAGSSLRQMLRDNYFNDEIFNGNTMLDYEGLSKEDLEPKKLYLGHLYFYKALELLPKDTNYITVLRNPIERVKSLYYFWKSHSVEYIRNENIPEIIRRGPKLAKENDLLDFLKLDDKFIQQSISNNQALQLYNKKVTDKYLFSNSSEVYNEVKDVLKYFAVVGVQELFPFFVFKFNRRYLKDNLFIKSVYIKNQAKKTSREEWEYLPDETKNKINQEIRERNYVDMKLFQWVYRRNLLEINKYFENMLAIPGLYK